MQIRSNTERKQKSLGKPSKDRNHPNTENYDLKKLGLVCWCIPALQALWRGKVCEENSGKCGPGKDYRVSSRSTQTTQQDSHPQNQTHTHKQSREGKRFPKTVRNLKAAGRQADTDIWGRGTCIYVDLYCFLDRTSHVLSAGLNLTMQLRLIPLPLSLKC